MSHPAAISRPSPQVRNREECSSTTSTVRRNPGTMRAELQAHSRWCKRYGLIHLLGDVTERSVDRLFANRMSWFGLEHEVMTLETAFEEVLSLKEMTSRKKGEQPSVSARTEGDYKRLLRSLRIAPIRRKGNLDTSISHLDLEAGTEARVA
jgi:hypothetical protein